MNAKTVGLVVLEHVAAVDVTRPAPHYNWVSLTNNLVAHTFFFGVPVLLIARRAYIMPG